VALPSAYVHKSVEQVVLIPGNPCRLMAGANDIREPVEAARHRQTEHGNALSLNEPVCFTGARSHRDARDPRTEDERQLIPAGDRVLSAASSRQSALASAKWALR
jgi:hypothetical protein